jgi:hypothetical protein
MKSIFHNIQDSIRKFFNDRLNAVEPFTLALTQIKNVKLGKMK